MTKKMKQKLKNINAYIFDDYGIDIYKTWLKIYGAIKNSIITRILFDLFILIIAIITAGVWAGSTFALLLVYPALIIIYFLFSVLLLLFAFRPDYVRELIRR